MRHMGESAQAEGIRRYYATDSHQRLEDETVAKYAVPQCDYVAWTLDAVDWKPDAVVLDIGCGAGKHYPGLLDRAPSLSYHALDLSPFMLSRHPAQDRIALGDAMRLPYADDSFDVVMANHVLYHLRRLDDSLIEIKRVLKPDGWLLAATNSLHSLAELQVLIRRAYVLLSANGAQAHPPGPGVGRFRAGEWHSHPGAAFLRRRASRFAGAADLRRSRSGLGLPSTICASCASTACPTMSIGTI